MSQASQESESAAAKSSSPPRQRKVTATGPFAWLWKLLTSYGLAIIVLLLMCMLTLYGTLQQTDHGLFDTQQKIFNSVIFFEHLDLGSGENPVQIPIPLPGGYLLMTVLFFNILAGAIIKARKSLRFPGMIIAHSGILLLLVGGFVQYHFSTKGYMALSKGQSANQYQAYQGWQLEVLPLDADNKPTDAFIITEQQLKSIGEGGRRNFTSPDIPFAIEVSDYLRNSVPVPVTAPIAADAETPEVNGTKLLKQAATKEAEANVGGAYVSVKPVSGEAQKSILWAGQAGPWVVEVDGKKWALNLDRPRWDVPFDIRLDEFIFDRHPGTTMARKFESRITKIEGNSENPVQIRMNEPLRDRGFTFFQESYGPPDESDPEKMWSQFSVVKNPADQWPLYSLIITGVGMTIHFVQKLFSHVGRSRRSRSAAASPKISKSQPAT